MSLANIIAVARNGLCVAKTLLPSDHFLVQIVENGPLNSVKVIEYCIALTQIAGIFFNISGGYFDIVNGLRDFRKLGSFIGTIDKLSLSGGPKSSAAYTLLRHSVVADRGSARTKLLVGFCKFNIGTGFIFLLLNTLHLVGPTHPRPLFDALIVVETSLFLILLVMLNGIIALLVTANNYSAAGNLFEESPGSPTTHQKLLVAVNSGFDANLMEALQVINEKPFAPAYKSRDYSVDSARKDLISLAVLLESTNTHDSVNTTELASTLRHKSIITRNAAFLDVVFLILNSIAFYGYLLGVLSYFFPASSVDAASLFGQLLQHFTLGLSDDDAGYYGFLAGDVAWTVEPLLAIFSGNVLALFNPVEASPSASKKKD